MRRRRDRERDRHWIASTWRERWRRPSARAPTTDPSVFDFLGGAAPRRPDGPAANARELRSPVPAAHRPGDGQGRGGHRLLPLQPPAVPQRGRRRAGPLRHLAWPSSTGSTPSAVAALAATPCSPPRPTTPSAARTSGPGSTSSPRCPAGVAGPRPDLAPGEPAPPDPDRRAPGPGSQRGVRPLPGPPGSLAPGADGRRGPCRLHRADPAVRLQGPAGGQGPHQLGPCPAGLRRGGPRLRGPHPRPGRAAAGAPRAVSAGW